MTLNESELLEKIAKLEKRIEELETGSDRSHRRVDQIADLVRSGGRSIPQTDLLSESFIRRAFAVWGHYFVAQLCIVIPLYCLFFFLGGLLSY